MNTASLVELLAGIKQRPRMYLSKAYISCLQSFLNGWYYMAFYNSIAIQDDCMGEFQKWIAAKHHVTTTHSWASIILFYSHDECDALNRFFELFEEFKLEHKI